MGLSFGAVLKPLEIDCLLDCKPRFELNRKALENLIPYTKVTWERPFRSLRAVSSQAIQVSSLVQQLKVVNLDVLPVVTLQLRSRVKLVFILNFKFSFFSSYKIVLLLVQKIHFP